MQNNIRSCKEVKSLTVWMTDKNKHASRIRSPRLESQPLLLWEQTCCRIPNAIQCLWLQIPQQHATDVRIPAQENRCATTSWWVYWSLWQDIAAMSKHLSYMSYYSQDHLPAIQLTQFTYWSVAIHKSAGRIYLQKDTLTECTFYTVIA